jgi:hypothetical protein
MAASIDDIVLTSFVADAEGFRDLDSIVRQRCKEIDSGSVIEYKIVRKDSLRYATEDIEDLLKERNGQETRVESVTMQVKAGPDTDLKFAVRFADDVRIDGECEDRANLVLLASDVRTVVRERMKSRGSTSWRWRMWSAVGAFFIGMFGFMQFTTTYSNSQLNASDTQLARSSVVQNSVMRKEDTIVQSVITRYQNQLAGRSSTGQLSFLVQAEVLQLDNLISQNKQAITTSVSNSYADPWWVNSFFLPFAIGAVLAGLVLGIGYLIYPRTEAVFLVGDEVRRQAKLAQRRERIIWGIGTTFILGVASGVVAGVIH